VSRFHSISVPATADRVNEDAVQVGEHVVVVVDGAGLPAWMRAGCVHTVQWFAKSIAREFYQRLTARAGSMPDALAATIAEVAASHGRQCDLTAGSPSATVAAWRVSRGRVEYLVLCDASLVLVGLKGQARAITDSRLQLAGENAGIPGALAQVGPGLDGDAVRAARREMLDQTRNRPGGFWCVQDDPDAAQHAVTGIESLRDLEAVIAVSDGASRAYDLLEVLTLNDLAAQASDGQLEEIADAVRNAENERARDLGSWA
jgi:hypothetical protein